MGKVHGALARAVKVRGQTPKVSKQEKKKQQVGRAKKLLKKKNKKRIKKLAPLPSHTASHWRNPARFCAGSPHR